MSQTTLQNSPICELLMIFSSLSGKTLLMRAITSPVTDEVFEEVRYLISEKKADVNICDKNGLNAVSLTKYKRHCMSS